MCTHTHTHTHKLQKKNNEFREKQKRIKPTKIDIPTAVKPTNLLIGQSVQTHAVQSNFI